MKRIEIIYNPTAGSGDHSQDELIDKFSQPGWEIKLRAIDDGGWKDSLKTLPDAIVVAGGDGTVKKVADGVLKSGLKIPLILNPLGTANNVAKAIYERGGNQHPDGWVQMDVGQISGVEEEQFFIESLGFGLFPHFIQEFQKEKDKEDIKQSREEIIQYFIKSIDSYKPVKYHLKVDKIEIKGKFLMVQLFNSKYFGANLSFLPASRPDDGYFDLCLLPAAGKKRFKKFLFNKYIDQNPELKENIFIALRCKSLKVNSKNKYLQLDDAIFKNANGKIKVKMTAGRLSLK